MSEIPSEEIEELLNEFKLQEPVKNEVSSTEEVHINEDDVLKIEEELDNQDLYDPNNFDFMYEKENQFNEHNYLLASIEILQKENTPQMISFVAHMMLELSLIKYQVRLTDYLRNYSEEQITNLSIDLPRVKDLVKKYNKIMPTVMKKVFTDYFNNMQIDFLDDQDQIDDITLENLRKKIKQNRITLYQKFLQFGQNLLEAVALRYLYGIRVLPVRFNDYFNRKYLEQQHDYPIPFVEDNVKYINIALFPGFFTKAPSFITDQISINKYEEFITALNNILNNMEAVAWNGWINVLRGFYAGNKIKLNSDIQKVIEHVNDLGVFVDSMNDVKDARAREKKPRQNRETIRKVYKVEDLLEVLPQIVEKLKQYKKDEKLRKIFPKK